MTSGEGYVKALEEESLASRHRDELHAEITKRIQDGESVHTAEIEIEVAKRWDRLVAARAATDAARQSSSKELSGSPTVSDGRKQVAQFVAPKGCIVDDRGVIFDVGVLDQYPANGNGQRHWSSCGAWLYPGDLILEASPAEAAQCDTRGRGG